MGEMLKFESHKNQSSIIKVIGVGGGGGNAVNHMFKQGIKGVDFIICNTDAQAMESSQVPARIQLGANLTGGLGAGAAPSVGRNAALENEEDIRSALKDNTKMLFITAGMGGGTGTGAAPVIAKIARELEILTVGIVTIPFSFEGRKRRQSADDGIRELKEHVDALLIISNDKLRLLCGDLPLSEAFKRADNVLTTAARGIAEIITVTGYINVDFEDVKTVMKNSGVALMGTGVAGGPDRAKLAVEEALNSPLLDNNDINGAGNLLLYITSGKKEITMDEVTEITDYIQEKTQSTGDIIWGNGFDETLDDRISVTIVATGFDEEHKPKGPAEPETVTVFDLYENKEARKEKRVITAETKAPETREPRPPLAPPPVQDETAAFGIDLEPSASFRSLDFDLGNGDQEPTPELADQIVDETASLATPETVKPVTMFKIQPEQPAGSPENPEQDDLQTKTSTERVSKLRQLSEKLKTHQPIEQTLYELEAIPAYKRRNVELVDVTPSSESVIPDYSVSENPDKSLDLKSDNKYLYKTVD